MAGRVMARRVMGKLAFVRLEDESGSVQLYVDRAMLDASQPGGFRCESRPSPSLTLQQWMTYASAPLHFFPETVRQDPDATPRHFKIHMGPGACLQFRPLKLIR